MNEIDITLQSKKILADSTSILFELDQGNQYLVYFRDMEGVEFKRYLADFPNALCNLAVYMMKQSDIIAKFDMTAVNKSSLVDAKLSALLEEQNEKYSLSFVHLNNKKMPGNTYANRFQVISIKDEKLLGITYNLTNQDKNCLTRDLAPENGTKFVFGAFANISTPKDTHATIAARIYAKYKNSGSKSIFLATYGCSGSGKTYTLIGKKDAPGVIMELYKLKVRDLSDTNTHKLHISEFYQNKRIDSAKKDIDIIDELSVNEALLSSFVTDRIKGKTETNAVSSRSHCIAIFCFSDDTSMVFGDYAGVEDVSTIQLASDERDEDRVARIEIANIIRQEGTSINATWKALTTDLETICTDRKKEMTKRVYSPNYYNECFTEYYPAAIAAQIDKEQNAISSETLKYILEHNILKKDLLPSLLCVVNISKDIDMVEGKKNNYIYTEKDEAEHNKLTILGSLEYTDHFSKLFTLKKHCGADLHHVSDIEKTE